MGIQISGSVGQGGVNSPLDVAAIGGGLVAVGVENGGVFGPPLSIAALVEAIKHFQRSQGLMATPDGRIDPNGNSLRRMNALIFPDEVGISRMASAGDLATSINRTVWIPDESSLVSDMVFRWTGITGSGSLHFFELNEQVVPRWFGVVVPDGTTSFDAVHIFFHPTPAQAGYVDAKYHTPGSFNGIFHYVTDDMAVQFCAADTGRVLVMPLMTQASSADCGVFAQRWVNYLGCMLGRIAHGVEYGAPSQPISSVVVSSFSSGIAYSHQFRTRANLGGRLQGVIDFDGSFSSFSSLSAQITSPAGHVVKAQQSSASAGSIPGLAAQNVFPLQRPRWGTPWAEVLDPNPGTAAGQIHALIPQTMMAIAAGRAG